MSSGFIKINLLVRDRVSGSVTKEWDDSPVYINTDHIECVTSNDMGGSHIHTPCYNNDTSTWHVKQSPEDVMLLIEAAK